MKYKITHFEIDTEQFQITSGGTAVAIEPKVFDVLIYLLENRGRIVSREELLDNIWAGREVSDTTLSNHIKSARKALGDNGELQQVIKTIRGRGYQLVAHVLNVSDEGQEVMSPVISKPNIGLVKLGLLILFIIALLFWGWRVNAPTVLELEPDSRPYIVVVPFSVSADDGDKWQPFADQMTREVILKLRSISGLRVIPAASAFAFRDNKTPAYVREKLPDVHYLLDATVNINKGAGILVTTELESLVKGNLVWNERYQSVIDSTNFFSIQRDIASSVSDSLKVVILAKEQSALAVLPTTNLAAYELYIEGRQQLDLLTHNSLRRAVALFSQAVTLDPEFDAAYIAKADAFRMIMSYFEKPVDVLPDVIDSVLAALTVKPDSAQALSSLGLAYAFSWRWQDAWKVLNAARNQDPNLALTELGFAIYYSGIGDVEGVYRSLENAQKNDPLNIELADWGHWVLAMVGENDAAIKWAKEQIRLHPDVGMIYSGASVSASLAGDHERAIALAKKGMLLESGSAYSLLALAQSYGYGGKLNEIPPLLAEAEQSEAYLCPYETAITYLLISDLDRAFKLFNDAVTYRSNCLVFTRNDPRLISLRKDPRFLALLTRVGLNNEVVVKYPR